MAWFTLTILIYNEQYQASFFKWFSYSLNGASTWLNPGCITNPVKQLVTLSKIIRVITQLAAATHHGIYRENMMTNSYIEKCKFIENLLHSRNVLQRS